VDTGLIIGGTAARFIIETATFAKVFSILRARSYPRPAQAAPMHLGERSRTQGTQVRDLCGDMLSSLCPVAVSFYSIRSCESEK
jgi:hypothetical protein